MPARVHFLPGRQCLAGIELRQQHGQLLEFVQAAGFPERMQCRVESSHGFVMAFQCLQCATETKVCLAQFHMGSFRAGFQLGNQPLVRRKTGVIGGGCGMRATLEAGQP
jgi:hypothetical protein